MVLMCRYTPNDPVFAMRESMHLIQRDMMMLENQLPLFVLVRLFEIHEGGNVNGAFDYVVDLAIRFFGPLILRDNCLTKGKEIDFHENMVHCLDVFRQSLLLPQPDRRKWYSRSSVVDKRPQNMTHCVTKLRDVGINFRGRRTNHF